MRKFLALLAVLLLHCVLAYSQSRLISGLIKDDSGNPIPFATVRVKGKNTGTSADENGKFSINASTGDILLVSAVNFSSKEMKVDASSSMNFSLAKGTDLIDEVVVTAQGIRRRPKELG